MYDVKKTPLEWQENSFRQMLDSIKANIRKLTEIDEFDATILAESADKIIRQSNSLPGGEATEMLEGLSQLLNIASARVMEVHILMDVVSDPKYVQPTTLARIVKDPILQPSCNLVEDLTPRLPKELQPNYDE